MIRCGVLVRGSCWDYIDAIHARTGVDSKNLKVIFKSNKYRVPYANIDLIKPGDWLYFVNASYHNSEHSAIFAKWADERKKIGTRISYQGSGKRKPARYKNTT